MNPRKIVLIPIVSAMFFVAIAAKATETTPHLKKRFRIKPFISMEDGALGVKRVYYKLACNETPEQLLSEFPGDHEMDIALLVSVSSRPCESPDETRFTRVLPGRNSVVFVDRFDEVWNCSGYCQKFNTPNEPPQNYWVSAYGTSHQQAFQNIACNGTPVSVQCYEIQIDD